MQVLVWNSNFQKISLYKFLSQLNTFSEQRKYAGHEFDDSTGLSYMDARYYDLTTNRFLSEDPASLAIGNDSQVQQITKRQAPQLLSDPQALNSYSYARNNPIRYNDPTGKFFGIDDAIELTFAASALYAVYAEPYVEKAGPYLQGGYIASLGFLLYEGIDKKRNF